jgi:hypothetical protein
MRRYAAMRPVSGISGEKFPKFGSYRLIYEIEVRMSNILGLIHGASDLPALWGKESRSRP